MTRLGVAMVGGLIVGGILLAPIPGPGRPPEVAQAALAPGDRLVESKPVREVLDELLRPPQFQMADPGGAGDVETKSCGMLACSAKCVAGSCSISSCSPGYEAWCKCSEWQVPICTCIACG